MAQDAEYVEKLKAENENLKLRLEAGLLLLRAIGISLDEYIKRKLPDENLNQDSSDNIAMFLNEIRNFGKSLSLTV